MAREASVPFFAAQRPSEVITVEGRRLDDRCFEEFRSVFLKTAVISQASGSAYVEFGRTKVMVGVYGPRQSDRREAYREHGKINCDAKFTSFAGRQRGRFAQSPEEKELSASILTALEGVVLLESFPKAVLDVYCTVLEAGGSEVAVAITAAALAVADAGVEMKDVVAACSVAKVQGTLLLDPTSEESYREEAGLIVAIAGIGGEVTQLIARGRWEDATFKEALELCLGGCSQLDAAAREALREAVATRGEAVHLDSN